MIFAAPWVLGALVVLPALWWLLRVTPPSPRVQDFPAIRLLAGLRAREETAARTPLWLLLLRTIAAALLIIGLARPVLDAAAALPGSGPLILVLDNGWGAAADWGARMTAANDALQRAERAGRPVALLTTARSGQNTAPLLSPAMPAAELRPRLAALHPEAWPPDRAAAAHALAGAKGSVVYVSDGLAAGDPKADAAFSAALRAAGPVIEIAPGAPTARVLLPPRSEADRVVARAALLPQPAPTDLAVLAQSGDGRTLARATAHVPPGATEAELPIVLPPELRNRLTRLVVEGPASAAGVFLLDEGFRRRPVGLVTAEAGADTPLVGSLYYLEQALAPFTELRHGDLHTLLSRDIAVIVLADRPLTPAEAPELAAWVEKGGLLLRFAGPRTAEPQDDEIGEAAAPDPLLPERLLAEDRQLGGALSWSQPARLAPFPASSPFAGLTVPEEVTVNRQVLAEPSVQLADHTWARLVDGTPLVTEAPRGAGRIVLFHVTANADWSNLPLSGLFPEMLRRLVALSAGVSGAPETGPLSPAEALDGFGVLGTPPPAAIGLAGAAFATTQVSPEHPPGLYGPEAGRRALNLSNAMPPLAAAGSIPGASQLSLTSGTHERAIGPWLVAAGLALLAIDLLLALRLRGLLRPAMAAAVLLIIAAPPSHAQLPNPPWKAALETRLAYIVSGDPSVDAMARAGLAGLSAYVNARTAAHLGDPSGLTPGVDDLSFYPLLYWPVVSSQPLNPAAVQALNDFMRDGGIIVIDSRGDPTLLRTAAIGLSIPPLTPLTTEHVLSRAFYLLSEYPGRLVGDTVWVQRQGDRSNDDVSPVVIGSNDWASAWAVDGNGHTLLDLDGGPRQRTLAYRFGVNLVMYALTGNYKGDQVHVPHILERLGQ